MKIKINDKESYSMDMPEDMSFQEFQGFVIRVNRIDKLFAKDNVVSEEEAPKKKGKQHVKWGFWTEEKNNLLVQLQREGKSGDEMSKALGIGLFSVYNQVMKLKKLGRIVK